MRLVIACCVVCLIATVRCQNPAMLFELSLDTSPSTNFTALCVRVSSQDAYRFVQRYPRKSLEQPEPTLSVVANAPNTTFHLEVETERGGKRLHVQRKVFTFSTDSPLREPWTIDDRPGASCSRSLSQGTFVARGIWSEQSGTSLVAMSAPFASTQVLSFGAVENHQGSARSYSRDGHIIVEKGGIPTTLNAVTIRETLAFDGDRDCDDDLVLLTQRGLVFWKNRGDGHFEETAALSDSAITATEYIDGDFADLDGDDDLDLAFVESTTGKLKILLNDGAFRFAVPTTLPFQKLLDALPPLNAIATGFIDRNAYADLFVGVRDGSPDEARVLMILSDEGTGWVVRNTSLFDASPGKIQTQTLHVVDLDGDGLDDLLFQLEGGTLETYFAKLLGVSNDSEDVITFKRVGDAITLPQSAIVTTVQSTDINGDCRRDLVFQARLEQKSTTYVAINKSVDQPLFLLSTLPTPSIEGANDVNVTSGDLDDDGLADLLVSSTTGKTYWFKQEDS